MSARRTHTKSRTGCINCKRRKVKCDEVYPACFNCRRHNVPCSLSAGHPSPPPAPTSASTADYGRFRTPGGAADRASLTPASTGADSTNAYFDHVGLRFSLATDGMLPFPPSELWSRDLELMHHYCTVAARSMAIRHDMIHVWEVVLPREAYQNPFVFHGILALSAAHKAYLLPSGREPYLTLSDYHYTIGSEGFRTRLPDINSENWKPVFIFASIVIFYVLMLPTRSENNRLVTPMDNLLELIGAVRGIRTTLAPCMKFMTRSELAPLVYGVWPEDSDPDPERIPNLEYTNLPSDTKEALLKLRSFQSLEIPSNSVEYYTKAIKSLFTSARMVAAAGVHAECGTVLCWPYLIEDCILVDMRAHKPHALLLLAHYAVFLVAVERSFWYTRGWAKPLVQQIEVLLSDQPRFLDFLRWPKEHVSGAW